MKILITIENDSGNVVFTSENLLIESAVADLYGYERNGKNADELENIIDTLTDKQEEKLKEAHMAQYHGCDDDSVDDYEDWLVHLTLTEIKEII